MAPFIDIELIYVAKCSESKGDDFSGSLVEGRLDSLYLVSQLPELLGIVIFLFFHNGEAKLTFS